MAFISADKFPVSSPAPSGCMHTRATHMWTSHMLILPDHPRSTDLLAMSATHHQQWGAALLICHSSSTVDHCPKTEADCTHLPPESIEVTSLGLELQRQTLGQVERLSSIKVLME